MRDKKVWLITGAGRGMGADVARAALAAGHAVVATGRDTGTIAAALGQDGDLLAVRLDVTDPARPLAIGMRSDSADVHPAGPMLDEYQDVQPVQQHGVHMQEIHRENPGGLSVQELPPGRA